MNKKIGEINLNIINALELLTSEGTGLFIGEANINHMKAKHPQDYEKYFDKLELILEKPDYVGKNPKDGSLEYVKTFIEKEEHVKVAVRVSKNDTHFVRSLYVLNSNRVNNFIQKGTLIKINYEENL